MSIVLGIWHLVVEGGKEQVVTTPTSVQITNISYGEEIVDTNSRDVVKLSFESLLSHIGDESDEENVQSEDEQFVTTVLCALTPGKTEQATVNLTLDADAEFKFQVVGKNTVYLTGNYIKQDADDEPSDDEDEFDSEDEEAYDLREVSSDVEMHRDDLDGLESDSSRFEEVIEQEVTPKGTKRARDSDASELTSASEKKKAKKLKAEAEKVVSFAEAPKEDKKKEKKKEKAENKAGEKKEAKTEEKPAGNKEGGKKELQAKKTLASGVVIQDSKIGTGPMCRKGNTVRMRYIGKLTNGQVFDKNTNGSPFRFRLGVGEVIKGWDEGIVGMQVGGERLLTIPPALAYGNKAMPKIPAKSTLVFEVKLMEIK